MIDLTSETRTTMKNGAQLVAFRAPHLHTAALSVVFPFVPEGTAGVYHLVEHMFFERAGQMRAPEINAAMNANGSEIDVPLNYADYYYLEALKRYLLLTGKAE